MLNTKSLKKIDLCNDACFKAIFRSIEARNIVATFLSKITGISKEKIKHASFTGGEIPKSILNEKRKDSDVIVKLNENELVIVEMNNSYNSNIFNKNSQYAFSIINETTKSKKKYSNVILINIDNFNHFHTDKPIITFKHRDKYNHIENNLYKSIHLILDNCVNTLYNKDVDSEIIKFSKFLKQTNLKELKKIFKGDEDYMAAVRKVEELSTDPRFIGYYDVEEAHRQDLEDTLDYGISVGLSQGISQGEEKKQHEIAQNMLSKKMPFELIAEITNLSISEIKNLKAKPKTKVKVSC